MDRKRLLKELDLPLLLCLFLIMVLGFINLWSASAPSGYPFHIKQLQWYLIGTVFMGAACSFDYRKLSNYSSYIYAITIVLLVIVMVAGKKVSGSQRWISLGFFNLQPSEPAKLLIVVVISSFLAQEDKEQFGLIDLIKPSLLVLVPFILIFKQPDLGTALLILIIFASLIYFVRLKWTAFLAIFVFVICAIPLGWGIMKTYQKKRIEVFLNPEAHRYGGGWHVIQSKIAVGSGGLYGKGFMKGTQAQLNFLPEVHTDFAFSIWSEEWGFVGAIILLSIYFLFLLRCLNIAQNTRDKFGSYLVFGITAMIFWQVVINTFMVLGLLPVVGIPLPLISYGGSSVITTLLGTGLILNVRLRRSLFQGS